MPEKYNIEIFEIFDWVFTNESDDEFYRTQYKDSVNKFLFDSLNWRNIESIDNKKITDWFSSKNFQISDHDLFLKLIELKTKYPPEFPGAGGT